MKELSIEEKAARYDEALKVAKSKIKNDKDHVLYEDDVIEILPELKVSEDEKIRKHIIKVFRDHFNGEDCDKCIAWLEKQGEQNAAWSEEDEKKFRDVIRLIEQGAPVQSMRDHYTTWLKSLKDRVQPQPKKEWSEEDEKLFGLLHTCVCRCITDPYWDYEKRENVSKNIIPFLDKLKTLIPQTAWKPSEKQMDALYTYIYNPQYFSSPDPRMELVESIYQELKKLKG